MRRFPQVKRRVFPDDATITTSNHGLVVVASSRTGQIYYRRGPRLERAIRAIFGVAVALSFIALSLISLLGN